MTPEGNAPVATTGEPKGDSGGDSSGVPRTEPSVAQPAPSFGTWEWDARTGKISWSPEIYLILGLDPQTFEPDIAKIRALTIEEDRWVHGINASEIAPGAYSIYYRVRRPNADPWTVR